MIPSHAHRLRFRKVLAYIDAHLDEALSVAQLSDVAACSKYHFHRGFSRRHGIGVHRYVTLVRLKRAAFRLAFRDWDRVIDIALECGYDSHEAFSRAFKRAVGKTPSAFRRQPSWEPFVALRALRIEHMPHDDMSGRVQIVDFEATSVAAYEHRGDPRRIDESVRRFIEWRRQTGLTPRVSATFNIHYDHPERTPPARYRMDICAGTTRAVATNAYGVVGKLIPGGRCARLRHVGSDDTIPGILDWLYNQWLPQSGETLRDFPLFFQRVQFFPDVPEHAAITDLFLPLQTRT